MNWGHFQQQKWKEQANQACRDKLERQILGHTEKAAHIIKTVAERLGVDVERIVIMGKTDYETSLGKIAYLRARTRWKHAGIAAMRRLIKPSGP